MPIKTNKPNKQPLPRNQADGFDATPAWNPKSDPYYLRLKYLSQENQTLKSRLASIEASRLWQVGLWLNRIQNWFGLQPNRGNGRRQDERVMVREPNEPQPPLMDLPNDLNRYLSMGHIQACLDDAGLSLNQLRQNDRGYLFLVPFHGRGGGFHSIVQEVAAMGMLGFRAAVATPMANKQAYRAAYPKLDIFRFYVEPSDILQWRPKYDVMIATYFTSVELLEQLWLTNSMICCGYYVQDYEPWFFKGGSEWERLAYRSYDRIPNMIHFAKTDFLCKTLMERHGIDCRKIQPSLDHTIFRAPDKGEKHEKPPIVTAMVRPQTPWRRPGETMVVLKELQRDMGDRVAIHIFGCDPQAPGFLAFQRDFPFTHHGVLTREEVGELLRRASVFMDLSIYQGFGRTGLEAMACGCVPILPEKCGPDTYAVQRENAILINTGDAQAALQAMFELLANPTFRRALAAAGLATAKRFSVLQTALQEILLFREVHSE